MSEREDQPPEQPHGPQRRRPRPSLFERHADVEEQPSPRSSLFDRTTRHRNPPDAPARPPLFRRPTGKRPHPSPPQEAEEEEPFLDPPPSRRKTPPAPPPGSRSPGRPSARPSARPSRPPPGKPLFDLTEEDDRPTHRSQTASFRSRSGRGYEPGLEHEADEDEEVLTRPPRLRPAPPHARGEDRERPSLRRDLYDTEVALRQAEYLAASETRPYHRPQRRPRPNQHRQPAWFHHPLFLALVSLVSLAILVLFWPSDQASRTARWLGPIGQVFRFPIPFLDPPPRPVGDYHLRGSPSLAAQDIDNILASYGSPAAGTGQTWVDLGRAYHIDPAYALAFFIHESTAGTHPNWAGLKPDGTTTHNIGNIICAGYQRCHGRFRDYASWEAGIEDWFRLIDEEYIKGRGTETVDEIIPIYAPSFENDVDAYVAVIKRMVDSWRSDALAGQGWEGHSLVPTGNPLNDPRTVMTQGYGVGTHAPAPTWGAIDLAIDSDRDGQADPEGSWGIPVYATHSGIVKTTRNSWPAGNHVWVINQAYKTGYAHLQDFAVVDGQIVQPGEVIGSLGSTGQSSGPHLDYQVWHWQDGAWVNQNPLNFGTLSP